MTIQEKWSRPVDREALRDKAAAFQEFQAGLKERCEEPPAPMPGSIVGTYGIFD